MLNHTWLEELASESNAIQAQEDIMLARVMASKIRAKLYMCLRWLFDHISGSMWLEEFASESNTIQAQEDIMSARVMESNIRQKLYMNLRWLFDHISRLMCSFEFSSFVASDIISLIPWNAAASSRKSV